MPATVKEKISKKLSASKDVAFVRREFDPYGSYRQVSRAIADLVEDGKLMRAGLGVLVKSRRVPSKLKSKAGQMVDLPMTDAVGVALEAFPKLGISTRIGSLDEDRLTGKSTQIPVVGFVRVDNRRLNRKIVVNGQVLLYEKNQRRGRTESTRSQPGNAK